MQRTPSRGVPALLMSGLFLLGAGAVSASQLAYSFRGAAGGGVALVSLDGAAGKIVDHQVLFTEPQLAMAFKVRFSADGQRVLVTNDQEEPPFAMVAKAWPPGPATVVDLPTIPDEVRAYRKGFLATCDKGLIAYVDGETGELKRKFKGRKKLEPEGSRPEDIRVLDDLDLALVSFQKDNRSGTRKGNRLVLLSLPKLKLVSDLQLPRDHPELHLPGNPKEQGPSPEVVLASMESETLMVTLDLYGAVAMLDLEDARDGDLSGLVTLPVSPDGAWGTAFPDRASQLPLEGGDLALVVNAGEVGGTALVDLGAKAVRRLWATPPGLEAPVWVPGLGRAVSVCSGKTKRREGDALVKEFHPGTSLYVFDVAAEDGPPVVHDLGVRTKLVAALTGSADHLVLVLGQSDAGSEWLLVDPSDGSILDRRPATGEPQRQEVR